MNFKELVQSEIGYEIKTTFWEDFSIADQFGLEAVRDTYNCSFQEWKSDYIYLTELVMILNWKIWQHYPKNKNLAQLYDDLWRKTAGYASAHLKDEELAYYYKTTD